jgi:hypothetical protein
MTTTTRGSDGASVRFLGALARCASALMRMAIHLRPLRYPHRKFLAPNIRSVALRLRTTGRIFEAFGC